MVLAPANPPVVARRHRGRTDHERPPCLALSTRRRRLARPPSSPATSPAQYPAGLTLQHDWGDPAERDFGTVEGTRSPCVRVTRSRRERLAPTAPQFRGLVLVLEWPGT